MTNAVVQFVWPIENSTSLKWRYLYYISFTSWLSTRHLLINKYWFLIRSLWRFSAERLTPEYWESDFYWLQRSIDFNSDWKKTNISGNICVCHIYFLLPFRWRYVKDRCKGHEKHEDLEPDFSLNYKRRRKNA